MSEISMGGVAALKHQISQQADYESEGKPINLKRRSGTADNRAFDVGNGEKRLKVQKNRAADTYDQKRPPKFGGKKPMLNNADLSLSPDVMQQAARKSPSHALLPSSLHATDRDEPSHTPFMKALSPKDNQHTFNEEGIYKHFQNQQEMAGPTTDIAESHQVNDQFIDNIRAKLDMLDQI